MEKNDRDIVNKDINDETDTSEKLLVLPLGEESKKITRVITNDTAREIMELLAGRSMSASEIASKLNIPLTTIKYNIENLVDVLKKYLGVIFAAVLASGLVELLTGPYFRSQSMTMAPKEMEGMPSEELMSNVTYQARDVIAGLANETADKVLSNDTVPAAISGVAEEATIMPTQFVESRDFLLFSGRSGKPQSTQRDAEKNNNPLRSSASSAVNLFCHNPLIQNKLKSL